jgi:hypothetical protein
MKLSATIAAFFAVTTVACSTNSRAPSAVLGSATADSVRMLSDISYLASDKLEGRLTGTPGNDSAAAYIARRFSSLKLKSAHPNYLQKFVARSAQAAHTGDTAGKATQNVVAIIEGKDPALKDQYIVIGAHYDHLGRSTVSALDPDARDAIRNGADDNASGTAAVLELARLFVADRPKRSVIFALFSGEEQGLLGSQYFVDNPPVPLSKITAMLNFDMVGRMKDDGLMVFGTATATEFQALIDSANAGAFPIRVRGSGDGFGSSDHSSFYAKEIPVLHFFTDLHGDYHRASDDIEKINVGGQARVVDFAYRIANSLDERPARLTYVRSTAPSRALGSGQGSQTYLGSIPDMAASETPGLRLTGIRPGSPADSGGLKAGDIIVEFAGAAVTDLYTYSAALYAKKPGDSVKIVFLRDGKRQETTVTLGKRGG